MASKLIYLDSASHYAEGDANMKWTRSGNVDPSGGRSPGSGAISLGAFSIFSLTFPGLPRPTVVIGGAYKTSAFGGSLFDFRQNVSLGNWRIGIQHLGDGRLQVWSGDNWDFPNLVTNPSDFAMHTGIWYYIELVYYMAAADPSPFAAIYVNGQCVATGSHGLDYDSRLQACSTVLGGPGGGYSAQYCDLYITGSTTEGDLPDIWGDTTVGLQRPSSDGATHDWLAEAPAGTSSGADHYTMVDDATPDGLATVLTDSGAAELHGLTAVPSDATVKGVQGVICAEKDLAGTAAFVHLYHVDATDYPSDVECHPGAGQFLYYLDPRQQSIASGADWTAAELNAMQFGIQRTV